jgi:eukaryotic-like serine/threonine-protein kinase
VTAPARVGISTLVSDQEHQPEPEPEPEEGQEAQREQEPERPRIIAGRFRVIRRLGAGAMASVFLAEDTQLGRQVAIKRLHPETPDDVSPRFRREMRVAASLSHPSVVTLYDATTDDDGAVLLIMEYVDGPTLAQRMRSGRLDPHDARIMLRALADAIDYLHEQGIIHRDIKPANILLDAGDRVKVTDLGIASAAQATGITTSGTVLGTPAYMAPELFEGKKATPAADIFSLAAVAFEMLSGRRAREGGTPAAMAMKATSDPPPDLREIWPDAGPLADVLGRGMARDPGDRPASAGELVDDIGIALSERDTPPTEAMAADDLPPAPGPQRTAEVAVGKRSGRRPPAILLVGAVALAAAAVAAVLIASGGGGGGSNAPSSRQASTPKRSTSSKSGTSSGTTSTKAVAPSSAAPTNPAAAVRAFYGRAAAHRYDDAWELAAPGLRSQLGGFDAFQRQFSTVRSIVFLRAQTVNQSDSAATVNIKTTATHTDHVDHCTGTADTAPAFGGGWVVTHLSVSC